MTVLTRAAGVFNPCCDSAHGLNARDTEDDSIT